MSLILSSAKNAFHSNPTNTVFDAKRLIGRRFDDKDVQRDIKHWPFAVRDRNSKPVISVDYKGEKRDFVRCSLFFVFLISLMSFDL
jgi:heat shock protein 5